MAFVFRKIFDACVRVLVTRTIDANDKSNRRKAKKRLIQRDEKLLSILYASYKLDAIELKTKEIFPKEKSGKDC